MEATEKPKGFVHADQVRFRHDVRNYVWRSFGVDAELLGDPYEMGQGMYYLVNALIDRPWGDGLCNGSSLDFKFKMPSLTPEEGPHIVTVKMPLKKDSQNELYVRSIAHQCGEPLHKNITGFEGECHHLEAVGFHLRYNFDKLCAKLKEEGKLKFDQDFIYNPKTYPNRGVYAPFNNPANMKAISDLYSDIKNDNAYFAHLKYRLEQKYRKKKIYEAALKRYAFCQGLLSLDYSENFENDYAEKTRRKYGLGRNVRITSRELELKDFL